MPSPGTRTIDTSFPANREVYLNQHRGCVHPNLSLEEEAEVERHACGGSEMCFSLMVEFVGICGCKLVVQVSSTRSEVLMLRAMVLTASFLFLAASICNCLLACLPA